MNGWRIWTKFKGEWRQSDAWHISSPQIPVPYCVLSDCMEWLRKQHISFFVEWL
jgi:hypothetical protein